MKLGFKAKALIIAASLAAGGAAHANTNVNVSTTGSLFMNLLDTVNGNAYTFDTGLTQTSFDGSGFYQYNLAGDANYQAFVAAAGTNFLQWDVISADNSNPAVGNPAGSALSTVTSFSGITRDNGLNAAANAIVPFAQGLNAWTSSTSNSAFVNVAGDLGNFNNFYDEQWGNSLQAGHLGAIDSALAFYSLGYAQNNGNKADTGTVIRTLLASTWTLTAAGILQYGTQTQAPVPLPAPLMLLMGGMALMGVIGRRKAPEGMASLAAA